MSGATGVRGMDPPVARAARGVPVGGATPTDVEMAVDAVASLVAGTHPPRRTARTPAASCVALSSRPSSSRPAVYCVAEALVAVWPRRGPR